MTANYKYQDGLETKRLLTRFLTAEDYLIWSDFLNDREATEFLPTFGLNTTSDRAKYWIERQLTRYKEKQFGLQAIINKETREFIGQCGLVKQEVEGAVEIEVGYHIFKEHWRNGYAGEAAKVFIDYAFQNNLTNSIISIIDIRNMKSQRVADKIGLTKDKQMAWSGHQVFIYRLRNEW